MDGEPVAALGQRWLGPVAGIALMAFPGLLPPSSRGAPSPLAEGLAVWRTPDKTGAACASCHSPDGIEIAAYGFDDKTILRRAIPHLGEAKGLRIVSYFHELRKARGITKTLDPMADRPMQPGGKLLAGRTPEERDLAFGRTLPSILPGLMGGPINSMESANLARAELLALDASRVRIGIPFNRLSEDGFHGSEHASVADWLPDTPIRAPLPTVFNLSDAYLASPSDATFKSLMEAIDKVEPAARSASDQFAYGKYRSMMLFQHELRMGRSTEMVSPIVANPMWEVGEVSRMSAETTASAFGLPADVIAKKSAGPSFAQQMKDVRLSWYWAGWVLDQGLQHSGRVGQTQRADYFTNFLLEDGPYPIHCAFMLTRKLAVHSFDPKSWIGPGPQHMDLYYSFLVLRDGLDRFEPKGPEAKRLFRTFLCNAFRMNLILLADELGRSKRVDNPKPPLALQIKLMSTYLTRAAPGQAAKDDPICVRATKALADAVVVRR